MVCIFCIRTNMLLCSCETATKTPNRTAENQNKMIMNYLFTIVYFHPSFKFFFFRVFKRKEWKNRKDGYEKLTVSAISLKSFSIKFKTPLQLHRRRQQSVKVDTGNVSNNIMETTINPSLEILLYRKINFISLYILFFHLFYILLFFLNIFLKFFFISNHFYFILH